MTIDEIKRVLAERDWMLKARDGYSSSEVEEHVKETNQWQICTANTCNTATNIHTYSSPCPLPNWRGPSRRRLSRQRPNQFYVSTIVDTEKGQIWNKQ